MTSEIEKRFKRIQTELNELEQIIKEEETTKNSLMTVNLSPVTSSQHPKDVVPENPVAPNERHGRIQNLL